MSLNGLDEPAVIDAYQTALKEAGGWLLLKYASRDQVTLLGRGSGGVPDVRSTIENYEEKSPLYGFLQYRRRKVVLKYIPDGMSRLVQARTTVQFQSILDKFSPQDTTFEFKAPADLTESALSSACLLHAVSGSITSSSSSLRRRRLMEIAEDAEEGPPPITAVSQPPESSEDVDGRRLSQASDMTAVPPKAKDDESSSDLPAVDREADARSETESVRSISRRKFFEQFQQDSFERRTSTQSMRPSLQELRHAAPYRQKVKPEYRPSMDINGRPRTAGSMSRSQEHRPTAALPAGVRSRKPSGTSTNRPKSTPDVPPVPTLASLRNAPPVPLLIPPPTLSIAKPKLSPGAKSLNALPSSGMSPEKQRLMKALELRKRQMEKKTQQLQKKQAQQQPLAPIAEPTTKSSLRETESFEDSSTQVSTSEPIPTEKPDTVAVEIPAATTDIANGAKTQKPQSADIAKADSAVEMVSLASKSSSQSTTSGESGDIDSKAEILHEEPAAYDSTLPSESYDTQSSQNEVKNITPDITSTNEATELSSEGEASMTPRTSDSDNTVRLIEVPDAEEEYLKDQDSQIIGNSVSIVDQSDEDIAAKTQETHEQPEIVQDADREDNTERSELITIVATIDDLESPDIQQNPSATLDEESAIPLSQPLGHAVEVSAEDTPLPCESGDDLQETVPTEAALESVSTAQEQAPLPQLQEKTENQKPKRLVVLDPIQLPTPDFSDDENLLSDDSFMEELTSATVQEAQPVSVGKGPLSPDGEPRTPLEAWQTRAVSNPSGRPLDSRPTTAESRSFSATFGDGNNNQAARPVPVMVAKKVNVSSGISKRIKALEMFSNNHDSVPSASGNSTLAGSTATPSSSAFEKFRKRASVFSNGNLPSTTPSSRSSFLSIAEPSSLNRSDSRSIPRMNSVSVTARIVRDSSSSPAEAKTNPLETHLTSLQRSPLIVRHDSSDTQISDTAVANSATELETNTFSPAGQSTDPIGSRSESRASLRSQTEDWRSRNGSTVDLGANSDDKKDSRRSRFLRRMSSLRSPSRKSLISPPPGTDKQQFFPAHAEETTQPASREAVDIGEVNVQFPDTLLWKRRFLRIDDQGYLVLTPANMDTAARNIVKRYHLSEFKTPCLPDEERQELPNSILLDFRDGNTLQCACESRKGQAAALQTLVEMHNAYQQ